jgi:hypothetical protein
MPYSAVGQNPYNQKTEKIKWAIARCILEGGDVTVDAMRERADAQIGPHTIKGVVNDLVALGFNINRRSVQNKMTYLLLSKSEGQGSITEGASGVPAKPVKAAAKATAKKAPVKAAEAPKPVKGKGGATEELVAARAKGAVKKQAAKKAAAKATPSPEAAPKKKPVIRKAS